MADTEGEAECIVYECNEMYSVAMVITAHCYIICTKRGRVI